MAAPIKFNPASLNFRNFHRRYRINADKFSDAVDRGWFNDPKIKSAELWNGLIFTIDRNGTVDAIIAAFVEALKAMIPDGSWAVSTGKRVRFRDNILTAGIAVCDPAGGIDLDLSRTGVIIDFAIERNEKLLSYRRRHYLNLGLKMHWMVNLTEMYIETLGLPDLLWISTQKAAAIQHPVAIRHPRDKDVPLVIDDVQYGSVRLDRICTT